MEKDLWENNLIFIHNIFHFLKKASSGENYNLILTVWGSFVGWGFLICFCIKFVWLCQIKLIRFFIWKMPKCEKNAKNRVLQWISFNGVDLMSINTKIYIELQIKLNGLKASIFAK